MAIYVMQMDAMYVLSSLPAGSIYQRTICLGSVTFAEDCISNHLLAAGSTEPLQHPYLIRLPAEQRAVACTASTVLKYCRSQHVNL